MKYVSEIEAEKILTHFGFNVVKSVFCKKEKEISTALSYVKLPCVMKVAGKKIVHKNKAGGVNTKIETYSNAIDTFRKFRKIKGFEGVLIQEKIHFKKEFLLGIKKTEDFGHVIAFGSGGVDVENKKDVGFRVCPLDKADVLSLVDEVKVTQGMGKNDCDKIASLMFKLCDFFKTYSELEELDINPFVFGGTGPIILDARMVFS